MYFFSFLLETMKWLSLNESECEPNYRSPLYEDSSLCPLCFLWTADTFWEAGGRKEREEQASTQHFLSKSSSQVKRRQVLLYRDLEPLQSFSGI